MDLGLAGLVDALLLWWDLVGWLLLLLLLGLKLRGVWGLTGEQSGDQLGTAGELSEL